MNLRSLIETLSNGELLNLVEGEALENEKQMKRLIRYTNEALLRMHSRFILKEKHLFLLQIKHITNYHLQERYAANSGSEEPVKYILDSPGDKFRGDVIKVLSVYDSFGNQRVINDKDNPLSVFTPAPATIQLTNPIDGQALAISYQASHYKIRYIEGYLEKTLEQEIVVPDYLLEALTNFIGYKYYSHMNGQENAVKAQEFYNTYEEICVNTETGDWVSQTVSDTQKKFHNRGFI